MDLVQSALAPLERVGSEEFCRIASHLQPRDLARLCLCSRALHTTLANDREVWRDVLAAATGDPDLVHGAHDPRRCAHQIATLGSAKWSRIGSSSPQQAAAPPNREQYIAFLCYGGNTLLVFGGVIVAPPRQVSGDLGFTSECWALDLRTAIWTLAAHIPGVPSPSTGPAPRSFGADGSGGAVLAGADGREWLVVHGGLRAEGFRDNETWVLGPLGAAQGAGSWRWAEIQADGRPQSPRRPQPRFHHSLTVAQNRLVIIGGHDHTITPILAPFALSLEGLSAEESDSSSVDAQHKTIRTTGIETVEWQILHDDDCEPPEPRAHHSVVALPSGLLVVFGGEARREQISAGMECERCHADTWILNPNPERDEPLWTQVEAGFPDVSQTISSAEGEFSKQYDEQIVHAGRARSALTLVEEGRRLVVCGGHAGGDFEYLHGLEFDGQLGFFPTRESDEASLAYHGMTGASQEDLEDNEWANTCLIERGVFSEALSDVWTLDLIDPRRGWARILPDVATNQTAVDGCQRLGHVSATAIAIHNYHTLLVLGGHDKGCVDQFGDPRSASAPRPYWAPRPRGHGSLSLEQSWACKMRWSHLPHDPAKVAGRMRALNEHSWCYERCGDALVPTAAVEKTDDEYQHARLTPPAHQAVCICTWPPNGDWNPSVGLVVAVGSSAAGHEVDGLCVQVLDVTTGKDRRRPELSRIVSS